MATKLYTASMNSFNVENTTQKNMILKKNNIKTLIVIHSVPYENDDCDGK